MSRPERDDVDLVRFGFARTLVEFTDHLDEFGFFAFERTLGVEHVAALDRELFLGRAQLIAQRLVARFERENGGGLFAELDLEPVDGVALLAEFGKLAGALGAEIFDADFKPPRRHGELGAQLIFVGLNFGHRQRRRRFEASHRQAHGAAMDKGDNDEPDQGRDEEADPEIHDRFNHETLLQTYPSPATPRKPSRGGFIAARISGD